jgi:peptide deformylase
MLEAEGAGLAAPQVGVGLRAFALAGTYAGTLDPDEEHDPETERAAARLVVNPQVVARDGAASTSRAACRSPASTPTSSARARLTLRYQDLTAPGTRSAEGNHAKALQHELDHLDGILFLDRLRRTCAPR